ncbi:MAG: hypothetical protein KGL92_10375 [Gammaproteobacteria bacterium]|nr:hypothetical protein [Gammaproteobacteria bacterium]
MTNTLAIDQQGMAGWALGSAAVTLNAGTHDITLNNAGNIFGTLILEGDNVQVSEAAAADIGASTVGGNLSVAAAGAVNFSGALAATGNVALTSTGEVTQSAPLTIGGNLAVTTTVNSGDVTLSNTGDTVLGNTLVGGNYSLTAGGAVTQAAGTSYQVAGSFTISGSNIVLGGAGNIVGGATTLSGSTTSTDQIAQAGVITLASATYAGNLTVISESANRSISSAAVSGSAIALTNAGNAITGNISVSASPPTVTTGGSEVQTGINQAAGTSISVSGVASFTAQSSSVAGSGNIDLSNAGNSFGTLVLSGNTVTVANTAIGTTTLASTLAAGSLTLATAGGISQSGAIDAPALSIVANGNVALDNVANQVTTLAVVSGGNPISFVDGGNLSVGGINAGGSTVNLTAGGAASITQTAALQNVNALSADAGGSIVLTNAGNSVATLNASTAGTGFDLYNTGALGVAGSVSSATGDLSIRTTGDLTLDTAGRLEALAGNVVASTEGAGNFINASSSDANALVVGSGDRWLVYSDNPDLISGSHTIKNGLTSSFRVYGATYITDLPTNISASGNGFVYSHAAGSLTVNAGISGPATQVYGSTPTGALTYGVSGFLDSEDTASNVISGGVATYSAALSNSMNAGTYDLLYTGGLTSSNYSLTAGTTPVVYTVTPAVLTYSATDVSRAYGAVNPTLSGAVTGFVLGQNVSVLAGSATWTTPATAASNVGQYAIDGGGYTASNGNYTFAQAAGNATALIVGKTGLVVTAANDNSTYDGLAFSGGAGVTYAGFVNGQSASVLGGTLAYGGTSQGARNAGTYTITPAGLTSGNYNITFANGSLIIDKAALNVTTGNVTKTYDGTLSAAGTAVATGGTRLFGGDTLSGGSFAFTNANAGSADKTVTVSGATVNDGNGGGNYTITYQSNTASTINPATLTLEASNVTKTYDGTTSATGSATVVAGTLFHNVSNGGVQDGIAGGSLAFTDPNAGNADKTVGLSGVTVSDGNGGGNYVVTYANNTTSTIDPATLTLAGTIADKTYDGTTVATLSGFTLSGLIGDQTLGASAGTANFATKNAGTGIAVSIGGIILADGANGGLASNYQVNTAAVATGNIDPKLLTVSATVANKVYDGTTTASLQSYGLSGFVGNESVNAVYAGSANFDSKDVGIGKSVSITGLELVNGANGGLASNYAVPADALANADITPATLHVAGVVALDTVYNGTTTADVNTQSAVLTGVIGSDSVSVGSISGNYLTKDVGSNKAIVTSSFVLAGADAKDYTLVQPTGLTANVTPRPLNVTASGDNKVYDGTTVATVTLADNAIAGDALTIGSTNAFLSKDVGTGKYVNVSNITLGGVDARDYTLVDTNTATFASITPATLTVTATGANKVYDGNTSATVTLSDSPLAGDVVNLTYSSAGFSTKNVGIGKTVTVGGIAATGADAVDYVVTTVATTTATITPATLLVTASGGSKPYDGNTSAPVTLTDNAYAGDQVLVTDSGASFATPAVGAGKTIIVSGIGIAGGTDAGNYVIGDTSTATIGDITGADGGPDTAIAIQDATLAPLVPHLVNISMPTPPPAVMDLTLPAHLALFAGSSSVNGSSTGSPGHGGAKAGETGAGATRDGIEVSLTRPANGKLAGAVSVSVPQDVIDSGRGFSFALPPELRAAAAFDRVQAAWRGKKLPTWLRYEKAARKFTATSLPSGALPIELSIRIGDRRWTMTIAQRQSGNRETKASEPPLILGSIGIRFGGAPISRS